MTKKHPNRKELLQEAVAKAVEVAGIYVKKPNVCVVVNHKVLGMTGVGFARWSHEDKKVVDWARRKLRQLDRIPEKDRVKCLHEAATARYTLLINRHDWNEKRGIKTATGRAVLDIVRQVITSAMEGRLMDEARYQELSTKQEAEGVEEPDYQGALITAEPEPALDQVAPESPGRGQMISSRTPKSYHLIHEGDVL